MLYKKLGCLGFGLLLGCQAFAAPAALEEQAAVSAEQAAQLNHELQALETRLQALRAQQAAIMRQQQHIDHQIKHHQAAAPEAKAEPAPPALMSEAEVAEMAPTREEIESYVRAMHMELPYGHTFLGNLGGTAVITSPFIHSRYEYGGSGLIVNYSSINKDLAVLRQRADFTEEMQALGFEHPAYPILELSGELEGQASGVRTFSGGHADDLNFTAAELDLQALVNPWFTGFMSFVYDNSPPAAGGRVLNSNLFLDNGFIVFGNTTQSPWYLTLGQVYVPFGQFSSYLISNPFNKTLFRTKARVLQLAYHTLNEPGLYARVYGFRGETRTGPFVPGAVSRTRNHHINQWGADLGYEHWWGKLGIDAAASYIRNVADSLGMQNTSGRSGTFGGFATSSVTEVLQKNVPGVDGRVSLNYAPFVLLAEYTTATTSFSPFDLTYNGQGAKPRAFHVEGAYKFDWWNRPSSIAIGYDRSKESLGLNIPKHRYSIGANTSIWRNTLASLEFRHDEHYASTDTASGASGAIFGRPGKISNAVTGQFDIYF